MDDDRPRLRCLVALPGILNQQWPRAFCVIDLIDWPRWEAWDWTFVALDPQDEAAWYEWRAVHPEAT